MATMQSALARDIPKASGRDSLTAVAARSASLTKNHPLPTPPNSISPNLLPNGLKTHGTREASSQPDMGSVESDLDLQDNQGGARGGSLRMEHLAASDTMGVITPTLLARHHLPEILLNHGPLPIRHIMGYLHTCVPGFSGIPPTKARRLVVGALEGRNGNAVGGLKGDVKFEKVGYGRWDAKVKGQASRSRSSQLSPPPGELDSYSIGVPIIKTGISFDRTRLNAPDSSWTGDSAIFSHDDEADKMSLDGDGSSSSSEAPTQEEDQDMDDDPEDVTDDEDWAAVGAAALRANSYSNSGPGGGFLSTHVYTGGSLSVMSKSVPPPRSLLQPPSDIDFSALAEREAVEALLQLKSV